jgi:hypothetical protein
VSKEKRFGSVHMCTTSTSPAGLERRDQQDIDRHQEEGREPEERQVRSVRVILTRSLRVDVPDVRVTTIGDGDESIVAIAAPRA